MNNKTIKLVSKIILFAVLTVVSIAAFNSCALNNPEEDIGGYVWREITLDSFEDVSQRLQNADAFEYTYIVFDLDDEECVTTTEYTIKSYGQAKKFKHFYNGTEFRGAFNLLKNAEEIEFRIDYTFTVGRINLDKDAKFEIRPFKVEDQAYVKITDTSDKTYPQELHYGLYANDKVIMHILFSVPLLKNGNYEEYYSDICDMLLENLVVIN